MTAKEVLRQRQRAPLLLTARELGEQMTPWGFYVNPALYAEHMRREQLYTECIDKIADILESHDKQLVPFVSLRDLRFSEAENNEVLSILQQDPYVKTLSTNAILQQPFSEMIRLPSNELLCSSDEAAIRLHLSKFDETIDLYEWTYFPLVAQEVHRRQRFEDAFETLLKEIREKRDLSVPDKMMTLADEMTGFRDEDKKKVQHMILSHHVLRGDNKNKLRAGDFDIPLYDIIRLSS
jgi:hypothetical protein